MIIGRENQFRVFFFEWPLKAGFTVFGFYFQALGNLYFIHESIEDVMIYDFIGKFLSFIKKFCKKKPIYHTLH